MPRWTARLTSSACPYASALQSWTSDFVVKNGLCPWAALSLSRGLVRFLTAPAETPVDAARFVCAEAVRLSDSRAELATTLVACPHVPTFHSFPVFERWASSQARRLRAHQVKVSLVVFHPEFQRWGGQLLRVGQTVRAHFERSGGGRSETTEVAEVFETDEAKVGVRRVGVRFLEDGAEQWVPIEWICSAPSSRNLTRSSEEDGDNFLPDNKMHRTGIPTVHLIRAEDLKRVREGEGGYERVQEVLLRNARKMRS